MKKNLAVIGCGDFLRIESNYLINSRSVTVRALFDPVQNKAEKFAETLGGEVVSDLDAILSDEAIEIVALFVPPWIRADLLVKLAKAGKHVLTTKPLASSMEDCIRICNAAEENQIKVAAIYGRTEDPFIETAKDLFEHGELGKLALYYQTWLHAYPKWNDWATDPRRNGGPFMDAMIHNLNAASYLMGQPIANHTFFSRRLAHPDLPCADTEFMVVDFSEGGMANLFITWAADLATHGTEGNYREHIDQFFLVTDQGWRITREQREGVAVLCASREGKERIYPCRPIASSPFDAFAEFVVTGSCPRILVGLSEATRDVRLCRGGDVI